MLGLDDRGSVIEDRLREPRTRPPITWFFAILFALVIVGCQQAPLPTPPAPTVVTRATDGPIIGVAPIRDARATTKAGMIGLMTVTVGSDLLVYLDATVKKELAERGFQVVSAPDPQALGENTKNVFTEKTLVVTLTDASISSGDALLFPANADVHISASLHNESGEVLHTSVYSGHHAQRVVFSPYGKKEGKIIATAAQRAAESLCADQGLLKAARD